MRNATHQLDDSLLLYPELNAAQQRSVQRRLKTGELKSVVKGFASCLSESEWPSLVARHRIRVLAAFFPETVLGYRTAFAGGAPSHDTVHLVGTYRRTVRLPGLTVQVWKGPPPHVTDLAMQSLAIYFPSQERLLLENLAPSRGSHAKTAGSAEVELRLLTICGARGEAYLAQLRERARGVAAELALLEEFKILDSLVGSILNSRPSVLTTKQGKAMAAGLAFDPGRLELFEILAEQLRATPLPQPTSVTTTDVARRHFAFLESFFSNFIEGTEFDVQDARAFVLNGMPVETRPKDSHDVIGVFEQALSPIWATLTLPTGEPILDQLRARHQQQMQRRPEVEPGAFKLQSNRAGNTEFVAPNLVRGTLVQGSKLLTTVPAGTARALLAMFLVSEVHPFNDGNGRLARLVMNAELSAVNACRIVVPTLYREQYLDCLRVLTRDRQPGPFLKAMSDILVWTSKFNYQDLDAVIAELERCHAFERSLTQFKLLTP